MNRVPPHRRQLTERHLDILRLVAAGKTNDQIARLLFLAPDTVKTHLRRIYQALGVHSRAAAVAEAYRRGLLDVGPVRLPEQRRYTGPDRRRGPGRRASDVSLTRPAPSRP